MNNYSIFEEVTLPSLGKVYKEKINPNIKLRSMTTEEEMKRLAPSENVYKNLCDIIDDCMVEDPGISSYDMCMADYTFLLHKLRIVTYGSNYHISSVCPYCANSNEFIIDLNEMEVTEFDENNFSNFNEFILPKTKKKVTLIMQTPRMADEIEKRTKELKKKVKGKTGDTTFLFTLEEIIDTVDGESLDVIKKEDFVRALPMMDTNYIIKKAEKLVQSFGINNTIYHTCDLCGLDYTSSFRFTGEFFRPSIDE